MDGRRNVAVFIVLDSSIIQILAGKALGLFHEYAELSVVRTDRILDDKTLALEDLRGILRGEVEAGCLLRIYVGAVHAHVYGVEPEASVEFRLEHEFLASLGSQQKRRPCIAGAERLGVDYVGVVGGRVDVVRLEPERLRLDCAGKSLLAEHYPANVAR